MKYYAKLVYNDMTVGYRYAHKGKFYDIGSEKKEEFGIEETNNNELKMIVVGNDVMTEAERDGSAIVEDLSNKRDVFNSLIEEDKVEANNINTVKAEPKVRDEEKVEAKAKDEANVEKTKESTTQNNVTNSRPKKYELDNKPTKKKTVTSKGVGLLIIGEEETLLPTLGSSSSDFLTVISVTSKTAIANINKILGARFNKDVKGKEFDKGKKEFKVKLSRHSIEELKSTFGLVPCLSQKQGWKYVAYEHGKDEKVFNAKIRLTDFAVPKGTDDTIVGGKDYEMTFSEYREAIFNKINNGEYILLADL